MNFFGDSTDDYLALSLWQFFTGRPAGGRFSVRLKILT
jgi:hypothetical protein